MDIVVTDNNMPGTSGLQLAAEIRRLHPDLPVVLSSGFIDDATQRAAQASGVLHADLLRWSLQALLCGRADEWRRFDDLFDAWFLPANRWQRPVVHDARSAATGLQAGAATGDASTDAGDDGMSESSKNWSAKPTSFAHATRACISR